MIRNLRKLSTAADSLTLTIPKYIVDILQLKPDTPVDIDFKGKKIIIDTKTETKKNGDKGTVTCPGKVGYTLYEDSIEYIIDGKDVIVNCYYTNTDTNDLDSE